MFNYSRNIFRLSVALGLATALSACLPYATIVAPIEGEFAVDVTATDCPSALIRVETQMIWTNADQSERSLQAEDAEGSVLFDSGPLQPGEAFAFVFTEPGSYTYRCSADGTLTGTITVEP